MTRADIVLLVFVIGLLPLSYLYFWPAKMEGRYVRVFAADQFVKALPLNQDRHLKVKGTLGHSHIEIKNGQVRFTDSPCTGKFCIHKGWLNQSGDFNACLPNQISVEITATENNDQNRFDSINF